MGTRIIVLDDDPTGCQTVHDVKILMDWNADLVKQHIKENDYFYMLINSRAYMASEAYHINRTIAHI